MEMMSWFEGGSTLKLMPLDWMPPRFQAVCQLCHQKHSSQLWYIHDKPKITIGYLGIELIRKYDIDCPASTANKTLVHNSNRTKPGPRGGFCPPETPHNAQN